MAIFHFFQYGGSCHPGFSKIGNFNGQAAAGGQYASPYQISSKAVKRLCGYLNLTVFQNGGHFGLVGHKFGPLTSHEEYLLDAK